MTIPPGSVSALRTDFLNGEFPREEYWLQMRDHHRRLADYSAILKNSDVTRIEIHGEGIDVVLDGELRMRWDPEDLRSIPNVMINHGTFEFDEARILAALGARARAVLDIGANAGLMSLRMAHSGSAVIHAFEPVPTTFRELEYNVRRNGFAGRIACHRLALGDRTGEVEFHIPAIHGSVAASGRPLFPDGENARVPVRMERLDDIATSLGISEVDLVKCDVEGAEILVMRGGLETIQRERPVLMLELLQKWARVYDYHPNDVIELLEPFGYHAFAIEAGRLVEIAEITDKTVATNFFFLGSRHQVEKEIIASLLVGT